MAIKTIPEVEIISCDICDQEIKRGAYSLDGKLTLEYTLRAWDGMGGGTDLCDGCTEKIRKTINDMMLDKLPKI